MLYNMQYPCGNCLEYWFTDNRTILLVLSEELNLRYVQKCMGNILDVILVTLKEYGKL